MNSQTKNQLGDILIVDDTLPNLKLLAQMLTEQGYQVRAALNGPRALAAVQSAPPDLILLDVMMPEMDGYELCRRLKGDEHSRDIPVLFISALSETEDKV
ncbi:response regulator, partial [Candidatus Bathyarchaeota archaeon]|nr:response regulator [Candidatus Bathyarchaeota archaeon]